jgi:hypothetical protein
LAGVFLFQGLAEGTAPFVDLRAKMLPDLLDCEVIGEFRGPVAHFNPPLFESVVVLVENNRGHSLVLVVQMDAD